MSTHNICFDGEIRKIPVLSAEKKKVPYLEHIWYSVSEFCQLFLFEIQIVRVQRWNSPF